MIFGSKYITKKIAATILVLSTIIFVISIFYSSNIFKTVSFSQENFINGTQSSAVNNLQQKYFSNNMYDGLLIYSVKDKNSTIYNPIFEKSVLSSIKSIVGLKSFSSYYNTGNTNFISLDKKETVVMVNLNGAANLKINSLLNLNSTIHKNYYLNIGGSLVVEHDLNLQIENNLKLAEYISLPVLAIALFLVFRGFIAALIPLINGIFSIFLSLMILKILAKFFTIDQYAIDIVTILGLGLSVDYSLLMINRFREEINIQDNIKNVIAVTVSKAGKTILFSGITIAACLLALYVFPVSLIRSISLGGASVILMTVIGALFMIPSILFLLGKNINRFSMYKEKIKRDSFFSKSAAMVTKHSWLFLLISFILLTFTIYPITHLILTTQDYKNLPNNNQGKIVSEKLNNNFNSSFKSKIQVIYQNNQLTSQVGLNQFKNFESQLLKIHGISQVTSFMNLFPANTSLKNISLTLNNQNLQPTSLKDYLPSYLNHNIAQININFSNSNEFSAPTKQIISSIRQLKVAGSTINVGGLPVVNFDLINAIYNKLPIVITLIFLSVLIIIGFLIKSIVIPIQAIIINSLTLFSTIGFLVFIFQENFLNLFSPVLGIDMTTLVVILGISFGISIDYSVFLYSRIHEDYLISKNNNLAINVGLRLTGPVITQAAILLFIVMISFLSSSILILKEIGLGIGFAVIFDAFIMRLVLVPAVLKIFGRFNWL